MMVGGDVLIISFAGLSDLRAQITKGISAEV